MQALNNNNQAYKNRNAFVNSLFPNNGAPEEDKEEECRCKNQQRNAQDIALSLYFMHYNHYFYIPYNQYTSSFSSITPPIIFM